MILVRAVRVPDEALRNLTGEGPVSRPHNPTRSASWLLSWHAAVTKPLR